MTRIFCAAALVACIACAHGQTTQLQPRIATLSGFTDQVTVAEVAAHFVTAIRVPEPVSSVVVGDPALFQVEHSDREPQLVFVKVLTTKAAQTNLLISTTKGHQLSVLVRSPGEQPGTSVDFLVNYRPEKSFVIEPAGSTLAVSQTVPLSPSEVPAGADRNSPPDSPSASPSHVSLTVSPATPATPVSVRRKTLDELLRFQESATLPELYGERSEERIVGS